MRYLNDWIWLRLSNRYNVTSATHSLGDVYNRWANETVGDLGVDLVDFYRQRIPDAESLNDAEYAFWAGGPLQDAVLWLDAQSVTSGHSTVPNLGSGGSVLNAQYGNGSTASTFPTLLEHTGENYFYRPSGSVSNNAAIPNLSAYNPTTAFSITARIAFDNWKPSGTNDIAQRTAFADPDRQWSLLLLSTGALRLQVIPTGSVASLITIDSSVISVPNGATRWVRVSFNGNDGSGNRVTTFEIAPDQIAEPTSWTPISTTTTAGTVSFSAVTSSILLGAAIDTSAKFYRFIYRVGGTIQVDADFTKLTHGGQATFVESSTNAATVTINRSTSGRKSVVVDRNVWLFGGGSHLRVPDNGLLNFGASENFTVMAVVRLWPTEGWFSIVDKRGTNSAVDKRAGYGLYQHGTVPGVVYGHAADGTLIASSTSGAFPMGELGVRAFTRSGDNFTIYNQNILPGVVTVAVQDTTNSLGLWVGALSGSTAFIHMELFAVAVWRRALTAAEIAQVVQYYGLATAPSWAHLVLDENGVPILAENGDVIETE